MSRKLPPLNALRCFEVAARRDNFTLAADELCLSPSAVSHQIRLLEDYVGQELFVRDGRRMVLTEAGKLYFQLVKDALGRIADARSILVRREQKEKLCIGVPPDFTTEWLMPQLAEFMREHRDFQLELVTSPKENSFVDHKLDCEIRYGHGNWPTVQSVLIMKDELVPAWNPRFFSLDENLSHPKEILGHLLVFTGNRLVNWLDWAEQHAVEGIDEAPVMHIDRSALAVAAAVQGLGICLESRLSMHAAVETGVLRIAENFACYTEEAYYFVYTKGGEQAGRVRVFKDWLESKAQETLE